MNQTDIIIAGGGIAGTALSILLAQAGLRCALLEPYPPPPPAGSARTIALMDSSLNIITSCQGLWGKIESGACPMEKMRIIDISRPVNEPISIEFPASEIGLERFGYNIPNDVLRYALYELAKSNPNIRFYKDALESYNHEEFGIAAHLCKGTKIHARLIVGADGRGSKVREIAGIETTQYKYDQMAVTCLVNHSRAHENTSTEFHKSGGPLALVPLPGNVSAVVWVESTNRAKELVQLGKGAFEQALMEKTDHLLGGMTLEGKIESWPLCSIKARALTASRCALVAEAAHVMSPITAQGLNLSLRDIAALAETVVDRARLGFDIGSEQTLRTYEKRRRLDIDTRVFGVDGMNRIVSSAHKPLKKMRRLTLKTLDSMPVFKNFAMQAGLAPQMDIGRLAKGEPL